MPIRTKAWIHALIFVFSMQASRALADELYQLNQNIRSHGMGGVYNTIVQGGDALFVNTAALAKNQSFEFKLLGLGVGTNGYQLYQEFGSNATFNTISDFGKVYGKDVFISADLQSTLVFKNFGIAAYNNNYILARFHSPPNPNFNATFISDTGFVAGGGIEIGPQSSFGLAVKRVSRVGGTQDLNIGVLLNTTTRNALASSFTDKGVGFGADASFMTELPIAFSPTLALTWQDIGYTTFAITGGSKAPPAIKDNLSLGISTLLDLPGFDWTNAIEYKYINTTGEDIGKKLHLGTEMSLPLIDLRAGFSQGYTTYGVGLNVFFIKIDAAYYKTEMGAYPGQLPNERLQIGLSIDFSFDANFHLVNLDGKKRNLKQRR